jgi:DNA repair protein RadC
MDKLFEKDSSGKYKKASDESILLVASVVAKSKMAPGTSVTGIKEAKTLLIPMLAGKDYEVFCAAFFDADAKLIAFEELFKGTVNQVPAYPREVFKRAFELNAVAMLFIHNHPSGDATPSNADKGMSIKMKMLGEPLEVTLLDHWIVSRNEVYSLEEHGDLKPEAVRNMIMSKMMGAIGETMHTIELEIDRGENPLDKIKEMIEGLGRKRKKLN